MEQSGLNVNRYFIAYFISCKFCLVEYIPRKRGNVYLKFKICVYLYNLIFISLLILINANWLWAYLQFLHLCEDII